MTDQPTENVFKQASPLDDIGDVGEPIGRDARHDFGPASGPTVVNTVGSLVQEDGGGVGPTALGTALEHTGPARFATPLDDIGDIAPTEVSATGAFARGAVRGALPAAGSLAAAGLGAELGAAGGTAAAPFLGPAAPAGPVIGGFAGALLGGIGGGMAVDRAQSWVLSKLPDSFVDAWGQGERQQRLDKQEAPVASFSGGLTPFLLTMQPTKLALTAKLPENATSIQTLMANPITARLFGGAVQGGMELSMEAAHGEVDWRKVAIATGFGVVWNKPNAFGERLTEMGAVPARRVLGRPSPTIAQASDVKVIGPGITEAVFQGTHQQAPEAAMTAQEAARAEQAAMGEIPEPNVVDVARQMEPELFARYDELQNRQKLFGAQTGPTGEEIPALTGHLEATKTEIDKLSTEISAAYRRAADTIGVETVEAPQFKSLAEMIAAHERGPNAPTQAVEANEAAGAAGIPGGGAAPGVATGPEGAPGAVAPRPQRAIGDQRAFIAEDVAQRLIAAGRPEDEARAAGHLVAARYVTRAGRFDGKLGSAEELYARDSAAIAGPGQKAMAPAAPPREAYEAAGPAQREASVAAEAPARELAAKPASEPGVIAKDFDTADRVKTEWRKAAPFKDTEQFVEASWHNQRALAETAEQIGAELGLTFKNPGIKARTKADIASISDEAKRAKAESGRTRLETKAKKHGIGGVTDQVRGGFDVPTPEMADQAIAKLGEKFQVIDEGWHETPDGYFDRKVYVRFPDGMIGELQFWPPGMLEAKGERGGHALYEQARELPPGHPDISGYRQKMRELYASVRSELPDDWKAVFGKEGSSPNLLPNASGESTRPSEPISAALPGSHLPPENTQASLSLMKNGSPSNEPALMADMFGPPEENVGARVESVNASISAADKINSLTPTQQKRELPTYAPDKERAAAGPDQPAGVFMFNPTQINVDAKRFQFKSGGDEYGVTGALRNVTKWDPAKAQAIIVWEQADGKLFVADGHQRAGLARRLTEQGKAKDIQLPGILYREKDGISADDIRAIAAVTNIANGSGSALDGAKVLRARPDLMDGSLPLSVGKGKQAAALARLGDEPFRMVVNDVVPEHYAAVVGELIPNDPERQTAALKAIARFEPKNADEAVVLTQRVAQAELAKREEGAQTSMFGDLETAESTAGEEMKIVGRAIADLKKDKALFARVLRNAERIEETGSQIEREAAQSIATDAEIFAKTLTSEAYTAGPIRQELIAAARELKSGKSSIGEASARIVAALREQAETHGLNRARPEREFAQSKEPEEDFDEAWARAEERHNQAENLVKAALASDKPKLVLAKGDDKILLSGGFSSDAPYRITSFDARGPWGHRDYGKGDLRWMTQEIASAMAGGFEVVEKPPTVMPKFEPGAEGKPQALIPGVEPVSQRDLIQAAANKPMAPKKAQKAADFGLFGSERDQKELFQIARGKIRIGSGRPLISLLKDANPSTFIHETGHEWLEQMVKDAGHADAPDVIKQDMQIIRDWFGLADGAEIQTKHHEKFARGFEQYLREGVAPSKGLAKVFADFRHWLLTIYQSLKGLGPEINPEIRGVFDRMLEMEPQRTVIAPERQSPTLLHDIHETEAVHTPPHEAEAAADRITAEKARYIADQPPEVQGEIQAAIVRDAEAQAAAAGPEAGTAAGGARPVGEGGGGSVTEPGGGGGGAEHGAEQPGRAAAPAEGAAGPRADTRSELGRDPGTALAPGPVDLFGSRESPFTDKAGNIRLDTLNTSEDVKQALRDSAAENNDFIGDRRGVVTDGQVFELAHDIGMDGAEKLVKDHVVGQAFNAEQVVALRKLLRESAAALSTAAKKAAESGVEADILAYAQARDRLQMVQKTVAGVTAEAGRALRAFRKLPGEAETGALEQMVREATGKTLFQLQQEAKLAAQMDTPAKMNKFMQDMEKRSAGGMILEVWINGLLSGMSTHATNMISNTVFMVQHFGPERLAAGVIGAAARAAGREGGVRVGELGAIVRGAKEGAAPALQAAGTAYKKGASTLLPGEEGTHGGLLEGVVHDELVPRGTLNESVTMRDVAAGAFGAIRGTLDAIQAGGALVAAGGAKGAPLWELKYTPGGQVPDIGVRGMTVPVGSLVRAPGRFLATSDTFFRSLNYTMAKNAIAYRTAAEEGLTGHAFDARVADIRNNPTAEVMEAARTEASSTTFMDRGGDLVRRLNYLVNYEVNGTKPFKFVMPFTNVISRILEQTLVKRTPLGMFSTELRADLMGKNGSVAQDTAAARMLMGSAMMLGFGSLAAQGFITGSGPKDPQEAAVWRLTHQPHSVKIGGIYYDIGKLGPLGMIASMAADLQEIERIASEDDLAKAGGYFMHAIVQNVLDQSVLQGPADLIKAIETPEQYGPQYVKSFLSSFVPNMVGNIAKSRDPYVRQTWTVLDAIKAKLPGYSTELHPKIDLWGQPVPTREALGGTGITSVYLQKVNSDPVNVAMGQLGMKMAPVEKKIRGVDLKPEEYEDYARVAGVMTKQNLDRLVLSPNWDTLPPGAKQNAITHIIEACREGARGIMMARYPHIPRDAADAKLEKLTTGKKK